MDDSKDKTQPPSTPNSQRPKEDQEWWDKENKILVMGFPRCDDDDLMFTNMWPGPTDYDLSDKNPAGEQPRRSTITVRAWKDSMFLQD